MTLSVTLAPGGSAAIQIRAFSAAGDSIAVDAAVAPIGVLGGDGQVTPYHYP
ncbi:MAG: hypothetical protein ACREK8_02135 [Gemmatimonadales bacterium]